MERKVEEGLLTKTTLRILELIENTTSKTIKFLNKILYIGNIEFIYLKVMKIK